LGLSFYSILFAGGGKVAGINPELNGLFSELGDLDCAHVNPQLAAITG
jgi:hypothetical protein